MTPVEFLHALWPDQGLYAIATPFTIPNTDKTVFAHKVFTNIDDAAAFADVKKHKNNIYFAIHTLKQPKVWNPRKVDIKTGEKGAYEVRVQPNMASAQCFFFDLDIGTSDKKYASQQLALAGLKRFCQETNIPKPMIVSSGGGLHVYWRVSKPIASPEWQVPAAKLKQLAKHHGLKVDPVRTTDVSSVLRVAGTYNLKDSTNPREVKVLAQGQQHDLNEFLRIIDEAMICAGLIASVPHIHHQLDNQLGNNVDDLYGPPVPFKALALACPQVQHLARLQGNVSEPAWYQSINLMRYVANPRKFIHLMSSGHPEYSEAETDNKITQLEAKGIRPTTCDKLSEVCENDLCATCAFVGKVKSPIVAARYKDEIPAPVIHPPVDIPDATSTELPPPPYPFTRVKDKGIVMEVTMAEGPPKQIVIYANDLYPVRRLTNAVAETEKHTWCVTLPRLGVVEFTVDADALYDTRKLASTLANRGIFPKDDHVKSLRDYMIAYINELQRLVDADQQHNHLGWTDDHTKFILPTKIFDTTGGVKTAMLGLGAQRAAVTVYKKGTLDKQVDLLKFYNAPGYIPHQFCILAGLGAPLFYATGHHGVIINMSGPPGASKSTTLYTAASLWGEPDMYPINGTNDGATRLARYERITTLANLPICVDEITRMPVKDAADLTMSVTQPGHRIRLGMDGVERRAVGSYKATILLATANTSLYTLLSSERQDSAAETMRVVEIQFEKTSIHKKHEADAFLHDLKQNFGHIGEVFMHHVIQNLDTITARVREVRSELDQIAGIDSGERFWGASMATALVAGEVANKLGLLNYNVAAIKRWLVDYQIPAMRGVVIEQYNNPLGVLSEYLEQINGDIIVVNNHKGGNMPSLIRAPQRQMLAHYDWAEGRMWILKKPFRDYCVKIGANFLKVLDDLHAPRVVASGQQQRIITQTHVRKVLGAGTEFAKSQSWCFLLDMSHPEVTGVADLTVLAPSTQPVRLHAVGQ